MASRTGITLTPNRALRVPVMSVSQFCEITTIRVTLEGLAVANAVARLDAPGLQTIQGLHEDFGREIARKQPDGSRLIALNKELHFAIYRQAGMPVLMQMIESLWLRIGPILNYDLRSGAERVRQRVSVDHHSQILAALGRMSTASDIANMALFAASDLAINVTGQELVVDGLTQALS